MRRFRRVGGVVAVAVRVSVAVDIVVAVTVSTGVAVAVSVSAGGTDTVAAAGEARTVGPMVRSSRVLVLINLQVDGHRDVRVA